MKKTILFITTFSLTACATNIDLSILDPDQNMIASTNTNTNLDTGCPAGTTADVTAVNNHLQSQYGITTPVAAGTLSSAYYFFGGQGNIPFKLHVEASDRDGISSVKVVFSDTTITQDGDFGLVSISELNPPSATSYTIANTGGAGGFAHRAVEVVNSGSTQPETQTLAFRADELGSHPRVVVTAIDANGNSETISGVIYSHNVCN